MTIPGDGLVRTFSVLGVLAAFGVSGGSWLVLAAATTLAVCLNVALQVPRRAAAEAPTSCSNVSFDHEQALAELLGLVGRDVRVLVAARADGWGVASLRGTLTRGGAVGTAADDTLFFAVGCDGGFFLPRQRFRGAHRTEQPDSVAALALHVGEAIVYVLGDQRRADPDPVPA
jgi:hypothetical protein